MKDKWIKNSSYLPIIEFFVVSQCSIHLVLYTSESSKNFILLHCSVIGYFHRQILRNRPHCATCYGAAELTPINSNRLQCITWYGAAKLTSINVPRDLIKKCYYLRHKQLKCVQLLFNFAISLVHSYRDPVKSYYPRNKQLHCTQLRLNCALA